MYQKGKSSDSKVKFRQVSNHCKKGSEVLSSASDKAKLFAENFYKNSNLDDSGIS